ncbi:CHAD domain-containing protein [Microbacterium xanthum]|uniref:CHAD domain-containing protein n=1 Tax=Microbacterium xanthum TaxID=3079794 RepID=UPI002AD419FA|nr:CHAD domain-containing protein [Microbacterium sp. KSW-48]MDZ8170899.1 CHAD domain-containing protein [Microbacterium sp. KSW-48]
MSSRPDPRAGDLVSDIVRTAAAEMESTHRPMLEDVPDGLHQHRTRVRRLRSVLAGFRGSLDEPAVERLRVLYAEWGRQLGVARDVEVLAAAAEKALEARGIADGPAFERLVDEPRAEYARAHARLVEMSDLRRARERARLLAHFVGDLRVTDADSDAGLLVSTVLRHEARRVRRRARERDGTDATVHALRKAGRRLRYIAEAVAAAAPDLHAAEVSALAEAGDAVHDRLGAYRDAHTFAAAVRRHAVLAGRAGEPTDVYDDIERSTLEDIGAEPPALAEPLARIREARRALG